MSLTLDVKRAFRKSKYVKPVEEPCMNHLVDTTDPKARHILGLDATDVGPARNNSTSTTSTTKLRSTSFSDATTAAVSTGSATDTSKDDPALPDAKVKTSSVLLKRNRRPEVHQVQVKPQVSDTSLRSFYDKSRAPLNVSQQTSDSSSRDFALRLGVPSIISSSSQEMEHTKQLRFFSKSPKSKYDKNKLGPQDARPTTKSSQRSVVSFETPSDAGDSVLSQSTKSRISVARGILKASPKSPVPSRYQQEADERFAAPRATIDPARAKVNVRRPKAGAKNWFDGLDTDSSDGESTTLEPQILGDFATEVEAAFDTARIDSYPTRSSSKTPTASQTTTPMPQILQTTGHSTIGRPQELTSKPPLPRRSRKRKINRLAVADLTQQSVLLSCSSSDDEEGPMSAPESFQELARREIRESLMNGPWDESPIELGQAVTFNPKEPERTLQQIKEDAPRKPSVSGRGSSRQFTYLDDRSSGAPTQHDDLITSFPRTPSDTPSRGTSVRESILSENASIISTKLMTVTRQEESLIAAMRLKKTTMKRAQAAAHRQGALKLLELEGDRYKKPPHRAERRFHSPQSSNSPLRLSYLASPDTLRHGLRPDSGTTFQTDPTQQPSVRSSMATYLSEGSEDLQLPYSSIDGLPMGSSTAIPQSTHRRPEMPPRGTFLSDTTTTTTNTAPPAQWPTSSRSSARDSHVVVLDPLERHLLREEIPSQLFMEAPFLGWEARANMQTAH